MAKAEPVVLHRIDVCNTDAAARALFDAITAANPAVTCVEYMRPDGTIRRIGDVDRDGKG